MGGLPPTTNGSHGSWQKSASIRKKWRLGVCCIAKFRRPEQPLLRVKLTCIRYSSSEPDEDNLAISFKSCIDGLKDAGIILDDKKKVVLERKYLWEKASPKKGRIKIIVEELK